MNENRSNQLRAEPRKGPGYVMQHPAPYGARLARQSFCLAIAQFSAR
jgi:hypothetical protein